MTESLSPALSARGLVILGFVSLAALIGGFGGWAYFAKIDSAIIALGQVEVDQNKQIVQHPDGGVVAEIAVKEAQKVRVGDLLLRLDGTLLRSELDLVEAQLYQDIAHSDRLRAELTERPKPAFSPMLQQLAVIRPDVAALIAQQSQLFDQRQASLQRQGAELATRQLQIAQQAKAITAQITATQRQVFYINHDLNTKLALQNQGLMQSAQVLDLQREAARLQGELGALAAARAQATERVTEVELEALRLKDALQSANSAELQDLGPRLLTLWERQRRLTTQIAQLEIRAPVAGVVLGLQVTARRAVLRPADPILYIVPQDRPLIVSVKLPPLHRDETYVGQRVRLAFPAFSARNTPALFGHLTGLSADTLRDPQSQAAYYRADIAIDPDELAKLAATPLLPGMPVEAFMETGAQSPMHYLLKPFIDYFAMAMRES